MPQTIFERALEFVVDETTIGLGSGRASHRFVELLGERVRDGLKVSGVPTSQSTAELARKVGVPLVDLAPGLTLDLTVDGADEVDPQLNLIKGWGRALVREKIVAATSAKLVILVGAEKKVPLLGTRGKLPIEVVPFGVPLVLDEVAALGAKPVVWMVDGKPGVTDNGNAIIDLTIADCTFAASRDPRAWELVLRSIPGVVGTGLFLEEAAVVLIGDDQSFVLGEELQRPTHGSAKGMA